MVEVLIQGILCKHRSLRESIIMKSGELIQGEEILYADLPKDEQYFRRIESPFTEEDTEKLSEIDFDERPNHYTRIQKEYAEREEARMTYGSGGVYAMINGELTYIPPSYWAYLNVWILEDGNRPEYREPDRIFCIFFEYLCFETDVRAITRGKARRIGATSLGFCLMWWICGREKEKKGGSISYNDTMADKNFKAMFIKGIKGLPICFLRDIDSKKAETFVRFRKNATEGLQSHCDFLPTTINSYDSGRVSFGLFDEPGKYEKMDVNTFWSKVSSTLRKGKKKVGFGYFPTTVNPKNKGGENFEKFWEEANQNAINPKTNQPYGLNTKHKVVRYFVPATEGFAGCIDKFGRSVIDDPVEPIMGNDGEWITEGSRTFILNERSLKEGEQLMEHRRDFPLDEYDMFSFSTGTCEFDEERIKAQIEWLEKDENKAEAFWRQGRLYDDYDDKGKLIAKYADDPKGSWFIKEFPDNPNNYVSVCEQVYVKNISYCSLGADTYKNVFAVKGSDGTICIFKKSCIIDGIETGLKPIAFYVGRPKLIEQFNFQAFLACIFWGGKINYEIDAGTWFYENFKSFNAIKLLEWEPARDPTKNKKTIKPGTESASPFQLAKQLEVAKLYFDGNGIDHYNGNIERVTFIPLLKQALEYNHEDRLRFDLMICFMMALLPILATPSGRKRQKAQTEAPKKPILPTFKLKMQH